MASKSSLYKYISSIGSGITFLENWIMYKRSGFLYFRNIHTDEIVEFPEPVEDYVCSHDGQVLVTQSSTTAYCSLKGLIKTYLIKLWTRVDNNNYKDVSTILNTTHSCRIHIQMSMSNNNQLAISIDNTINIWSIDNPNQPKLLFSFRDESSIKSCSISPGGTMVANSLDTNTTNLWSIDSQKLLCVFKDSISSSFSPDGSRISIVGIINTKTHVSDINIFNIRNPANPKKLLQIKDQTCCTFSKHNRDIVATGSLANSSTSLINITTGECLLFIKGGRENCESVYFSNCGNYFANLTNTYSLAIRKIPDNITNH